MIKIKLIIWTVTLLFLGSNSIFAGIFDLINDIETGIGIGYNVNYWNLATSKIGTRAGGISVFTKTNGARIAEVAEEKFIKLAEDSDNQTIKDEVESLKVTGSNFTGTGTGASLNGFNIDFQANYHIFNWFFLRSGATIDIAAPQEFSLTGTLNLKSKVLNSELTDTVNYKVSGLDIEIPFLLGFNLINTDNFNAYGAVGLNFVFGGYKEVFSGTRQFASSELIHLAEREGIDLKGRGDLTSVANQYNAFQIGIQWLLGIKYKMTKNISIFTEVKWLNAGGIVDRTGTAAQETDDDNLNLATKSPIGAALNLAASVSARNGATDSDTDTSIDVVAPVSSEKNAENNVTALLNRSYVRWVLGATYMFDL